MDVPWDSSAFLFLGVKKKKNTKQKHAGGLSVILKYNTLQISWAISFFFSFMFPISQILWKLKWFKEQKKKYKSILSEQ